MMQQNKYSINTVCEICQISRATLYRYIKLNLIPKPHVEPIDNRRRFFNKKEVEQIKQAVHIEKQYL